MIYEWYTIYYGYYYHGIFTCMKMIEQLIYFSALRFRKIGVITDTHTDPNHIHNYIYILNTITNDHGGVTFKFHHSKHVAEKDPSGWPILLKNPETN